MSTLILVAAMVVYLLCAFVPVLSVAFTLLMVLGLVAYRARRRAAA